jgi:hypothetical protein
MPKLIYHDSDGIDKSFNLGAEPVLIGRAGECQIQTQDAMVSRRHAQITWDGNYWVEDLGSSNGVYVGQQKVQRAPFRPGDIVTCGSLVMRMIPDTARATSSMAPQSYSPQAQSHNTPPPSMQHPTLQPAGRSQQAATSAMDVRSGRTPPSGYPADVRSGRTPPAGTPSFGGAELAEERRRREEAEAAVLSAAERVQIAEARAAEFEAGAREAAQLRRRVAELERAQGGGGDGDEAAKLRRQVEQMQADLRRMRTGGGDAGKMAELTDQLRRAESDRDALRVQLSQQPARGGGGTDPAAADAAIALGDALAELRSSLRAASDEATALTAPSQSVAVVTDALGQANEQLESARGHLRTLGKLLGVA